MTWQAGLWAGGALVLILGALALVLFTGSPSSATVALPQTTATDITFGPRGAPVVVVEYADFECRPCAVNSPMFGALRAEYGDQVLFVFRFFPLAYHKHGMLSAQVAYAAHLQGKFWEMHDLLFERQKEWAGAADAYPYFEAYANSLGLDMKRFRDDVNAEATKDVITRQKEAGSEAGVNHTPWFAVNDRVVVSKDIRDYEALIDADL